MKKILKSSAIVLAVAAIAGVATISYFSDTETSTGNTFTAGAIDLQIDYDGYYNKAVDGTPNAGDWALTDLTGEKFFEFSDIKPGDFGEGTISMHVFNNDAWACLTIEKLVSADNSCTEPEKVAEGGNACDVEGELAQNLIFTAWADPNCNNVWDGQEPLLFSNKKGPASDVLNGKTYALADSTTGNGPIRASQNQCIGIKWCAGSMEINETTGVIACDGSAMGNESQTDSLTADVRFYVEQERNNPNFQCVPANKDIERLALENKDQNYNRLTNDGTYGVLEFNKSGATFDYKLEAYGLVASTEYSLIYYADGWPGNHPGALIGTHTTDASGKISSVSGTNNINTDIPNIADANYSLGGGKIWLIPSSAYNSGTNSVTVWPFTDKWLFESNLIKYDDTDATP